MEVCEQLQIPQGFVERDEEDELYGRIPSSIIAYHMILLLSCSIISRVQSSNQRKIDLVGMWYWHLFVL